MRTTLTLANPSIIMSQQTTMPQGKTKKSLAQEVRQKSDISEHRSKG